MISKNMIFITIILLVLSSCDRKISTELLEKEDKFTLAIGNMDSELDFFTRDGISFSLKSDIYMSKGIFYISNGNGKKIMKFNSYGNLLQKISPNRQSDSIPHDNSTWTFNEPGSISATENYIYIEDTIKYEIALSENYIDKSYDTTDDKSDKERHILNEKIISIFNNKGDYINFIGQEGIEGSTPFPFIQNIYNDSNNRLIVVTQTTFFWTIYRYTESGDFIDKNTIELDYLPQLENEESTITQINNIIPDRDKERVLVELTFFKKIIDDKTNAIVSMESVKSRVYYYDLIEKKYISWMDLPGTNNNVKEEIGRHYILLDIVKGKYLFFTSQGTDGTMQFLTVTNENGYVIGEYNLNIDNTNIIYTSFYVSYPEGILTALLCTEYAGGITMWRTDKIIDEDLK